MLLVGHNYINSIMLSSTLNESYSISSIILLLYSGTLVFYPMHWAGMSGLSRRIPSYSDYFISFTIVGYHGTLLLLYFTLIFIRTQFILCSGLTYSNYNNSSVLIVSNKYVLVLLLYLTSYRYKELLVLCSQTLNKSIKSIILLIRYNNYKLSILLFNKLVYYLDFYIKLLGIDNRVLKSNLLILLV